MHEVITVFRTIDSAYYGPYPLRIEYALNERVSQIYKDKPDHFVVLATHFSPENGVDFSGRWPRVYTLLQRDENGDIQIAFNWRDEDDKLITLDTWLLEADEIQLAWLSYPYENED